MDTIHWFLDGKEDIHLSYYLAKNNLSPVQVFEQ
jgi:hypothetical protein